MIASLTFPEVLVQQVSLFISSPFFLCDCPGLPASQLRTHLCHRRNTHEQQNGSAPPKQEQHLFRAELRGPSVGAAGLPMPSPPQMANPKVSCCKTSGMEERLGRNSSCLSWVNLAKLFRVLQKRSTGFSIWIALAFFLSYCLLNPVAQMVVPNRTPVLVVFSVAVETKKCLISFWYFEIRGVKSPMRRGKRSFQCAFFPRTLC